MPAQSVPAGGAAGPGTAGARAALPQPAAPRGPAWPGSVLRSPPSPPIYSVSADVFFRTFSIKFYNGVKDKE